MPVKVAIVTGGNSGIGFQTALELCKRGYFVIITGRSEHRLQAALERLKKEYPEALADSMLCDLSSLAAIEKFVFLFKKRKLPLHLLVNNAGGLFREPFFTADGLEHNFGVNHLGHFYLTLLLLDVLKKSAPARIVHVSSYAHLAANNVDWDSVAFNENPTFIGYANSKLATILFSRQLGKHLKDTGVYSFVTHPGFSKTEVFDKQTGIHSWLLWVFGNTLATSAKTGAQSQIYAATEPSLELKDYSCTLIGPAIPLPLFPQTSYQSPSHLLYNTDENALKLWNWCKNLLEEKRGFSLE